MSKGKMIGFRISEEEFEEFAELAIPRGMSVSMWCRIAAFDALRAKQKEQAEKLFPLVQGEIGAWDWPKENEEDKRQLIFRIVEN